MVFHDGQNFLVPTRRDDYVIVQKGENIMSGGVDTLVLAVRIRIVAVVFNDVRANGLKKLPAAVGGIIVHDDQLERQPRVALQGGMENLIDRKLVVNCGDDADHLIRKMERVFPVPNSS